MSSLPITSPIPSPSPARGREYEEREYKVKHPVNGSVLQHAREMRKNPTEAEEYLWKFLRFDQLGVRFRRQHPVRGRILDFYCVKAKLGIEVDGSIHNDPTQKENDAIRTDEMNEEGIEIIRFTNEEVISDTENVLHSIQSYLCSH